jgi:hypothetical protein
MTGNELLARIASVREQLHALCSQLRDVGGDKSDERLVFDLLDTCNALEVKLYGLREREEARHETE